MHCRTFASLAAVAVAISLPLPGRAHMAATGWRYDWDCCSTNDCARVRSTNVVEGENGVTVRLQPGEHPMILWPMTVTIPYGSKQLRYHSPDGYFHVCHSRQYLRPDGSRRVGKVICVYLPPRSL